ncbi:MAG: methyltransferase domain-containing protein [Planctomycetota bacterium]
MSTQPRRQVPETWYETSFGAEYLRIYRRRDELQARNEVEFVIDQLRLDVGAPVLDLCCGAGRHLKWLRRNGLAALGLDLSGPLLEAAQERLSAADDGGGAAPLVRADMRSLPFAGAFRGLVSFFTSFGYFADAGDDARAVAEMGRVLAPGGRFVVDLMDRESVVRDLVPRSLRSEGDMEIAEERWISDDGGRVEKEVTVTRAGAVQRFHESVRMYTRADAEALLASGGLHVETCFGDFHGTAHDPGATARMILVGSRGQQ